MKKKLTKLYFRPIIEDDKELCPHCKVELEFDGTWFGMNRYSRGNEGHKYICPKCGWSYIDIYLYRD